MKTNTTKNCWRLWIILFTLIGAILACDTSGVDPKDTRLQPPVSNSGMRLDEFLKQLDVAPRGSIPPPWITSPEDHSYNASSTFEVKGWAKHYRDGEIVVYEVVPNPDMRGVSKEVRKLSSAQVNKTDHGWSANIKLSDEKVFLAARIERRKGKVVGNFSNIIYVSAGEPIPLTIISPKMDDVVKTDTNKVNLTGMGEPGVWLEFYVNEENTNLTTQIGADRKWEIKDVSLLLAGFDKKTPKQDLNVNQIMVRAKATAQETNVNVRLVIPIRLHWPFGYEIDGKPKGQVSAFYHNDWHMFGCDKNGREYRDSHPALDISTGKGQAIQAVAGGIVTGMGSKSYGNYLIVDSGGWGTLYLHIVEDGRTKKKVELGGKVEVGDEIATEGNTGEFTTGIHLHISIRIWKLHDDRSNPGLFGSLENAVNLNPPSSYRDYFNGMNIELYDWWGGSEFCDPEGCWDIDWSKVKLLQPKPTTDWANAYYDGTRWTCGERFCGKCWPNMSPYTTRRHFCNAHPENCQKGK